MPQDVPIEEWIMCGLSFCVYLLHLADYKHICRTFMTEKIVRFAMAHMCQNH